MAMYQMPFFFSPYYSFGALRLKRQGELPTFFWALCKYYKCSWRTYVSESGEISIFQFLHSRNFGSLLFGFGWWENRAGASNLCCRNIGCFFFSLLSNCNSSVEIVKLIEAVWFDQRLSFVWLWRHIQFIQRNEREWKPSTRSIHLLWLWWIK